MASHTSPRLIPGASDSLDGTSSATEEINYGSFRAPSEAQNSVINPSMAAGQREPTRSFVHLSYRGSLGMQETSPLLSVHVLNTTAAPVDSAQYAKSVREDTAELASYALSDKASIQSTSPPTRRAAQTHLESYFQQSADSESASNHSERLRHHIIEEVSEPVSPAEGGPAGRSPGTSALADLLRRSPPPSRSPPDNEEDEDDASSHTGGQDEIDSDQGRLIITSDGVKMDATERAPLIGKDMSLESQHSDWIHGRRDIEAQQIRRKVSWPKMRQVILWPKEKCYDIVKVVSNPKEWPDRKTIWENAVKAPVECLPAVILGLLLNILDALSYGELSFCVRCCLQIIVPSNSFLLILPF